MKLLKILVILIFVSACSDDSILVADATNDLPRQSNRTIETLANSAATLVPDLIDFEVIELADSNTIYAVIQNAIYWGFLQDYYNVQRNIILPEIRAAEANPVSLIHEFEGQWSETMSIKTDRQTFSTYEQVNYSVDLDGYSPMFLGAGPQFIFLEGSFQETRIYENGNRVDFFANADLLIRHEEAGRNIVLAVSITFSGESDGNFLLVARSAQHEYICHVSGVMYNIWECFE